MHKQFFNVIPNGNVATILLYGEVGSGRGVDAKEVVTELLMLANTYNRIEVRINSVGGDVFAGIAIYNALKGSTADITLYVDGLAASIAGVIALCGKPLYMSKHAKLMLHNVSGGAWGSAKELRETATLIEDLEKDLSAIVAGRLKMTAEQVCQQYFDGKDHWFTAEQAQQLGLIDGLFDGTEPDPVADNASTEDIYNAFNNRLQNQAQNNTYMGLLDELKSVSSLANVASEAEAVAKVRQLESQATKVQALEQAIEGYKTKINAMEQAELKALLDTAIAEKKITDAQRPTYEALLKSDKDNTIALLNSLTPAKPKEMANEWIDPTGGATDKFANKKWAELDKAGLLGELKATNKALFCQLFKQEFGCDYKD